MRFVRPKRSSSLSWIGRHEPRGQPARVASLIRAALAQPAFRRAVFLTLRCRCGDFWLLWRRRGFIFGSVFGSAVHSNSQPSLKRASANARDASRSPRSDSPRALSAFSAARQCVHNLQCGCSVMTKAIAVRRSGMKMPPAKFLISNSPNGKQPHLSEPGFSQK